MPGHLFVLLSSFAHLGSRVNHQLEVVVGKLLDESLGQAAAVDGVGGGVEDGLVAAVQLGAEAGQVSAGAVALLQLLHQLLLCELILQPHAPGCTAVTHHPGSTCKCALLQDETRKCNAISPST
jgi:hypothetical protein